MQNETYYGVAGAPLNVGFIRRLLPSTNSTYHFTAISGDHDLRPFVRFISKPHVQCEGKLGQCCCEWRALFTRNLFMDIREFHLSAASNRSWWNYVDRVRRRKKMRHLNSLKFYFCNIKAAMEMNYGIFLRKGGRSTGQLNIKWLICSLAI